MSGSAFTEEERISVMKLRQDFQSNPVSGLHPLKQRNNLEAMLYVCCCRT